MQPIGLLHFTGKDGERAFIEASKILALWDDREDSTIQFSNGEYYKAREDATTLAARYEALILRSRLPPPKDVEFMIPGPNDHAIHAQ